MQVRVRIDGHADPTACTARGGIFLRNAKELIRGLLLGKVEQHLLVLVLVLLVLVLV
jgi:hypothetical protein